MQRTRIHVGIISAVKIYEEGVTERLKREPGIEVSIPSLSEDSKPLGATRPLDVLIVDDGVPELTKLIRSSKKQFPNLKHIVLILFENVDSVFHCVEERVDGFISKHASLNELVECIETVAQDKQKYDAETAMLLLRKLTANDKNSDKTNQIMSLTGRQKNVLDLIGQGYSNKKIAQTLGIEVSTVKNHVHTILVKLDAKNRSEAATYTRM